MMLASAAVMSRSTASMYMDVRLENIFFPVANTARNSRNDNYSSGCRSEEEEIAVAGEGGCHASILRRVSCSKNKPLDCLVKTIVCGRGSIM